MFDCQLPTGIPIPQLECFSVFTDNTIIYAIDPFSKSAYISFVTFLYNLDPSFVSFDALSNGEGYIFSGGDIATPPPYALYDTASETIPSSKQLTGFFEIAEYKNNSSTNISDNPGITQFELIYKCVNDSYDAWVYELYLLEVDLGIPFNSFNTFDPGVTYLILHKMQQPVVPYLFYDNGANSVTPTPTVTQTPSNTQTPTPSNTQTVTPTNTIDPTPTLTVTTSETPTQTPSNTQTPTPSNTQTPTPSNTQTVTPSNSLTPTPSNTQTVTPSNEPTQTPSNTQTPTPSNTQTVTPSNSLTPTPSNTQTVTPSTPVPFYSINIRNLTDLASNSIDEGLPGVFWLSGFNISQSQISYTITGISQEDINIPLTGIFESTGSIGNYWESATVDFTILSDFVTNEVERLIVTLDGITPTVSAELIINDVLPTPTPTVTPTETPTETPTPTPTPTPSETPSETPTVTPTSSQTPTNTQTSTQTQTPTPSITPSSTPIDYGIVVSPQLSTVGLMGATYFAVGEPSTITFTITSTRNPETPVNIEYNITGVDLADFIPGTDFTGTLNYPLEKFATFHVVADARTEGNQLMTLTIVNGPTNAIGKKGEMYIVDTSQSPPAYTLFLSGNGSTTGFVNEGSTVTFALETRGAYNGTPIFYQVTGINEEDIIIGESSPLSGYFVINSIITTDTTEFPDPLPVDYAFIKFVLKEDISANEGDETLVVTLSSHIDPIRGLVSSTDGMNAGVLIKDTSVTPTPTPTCTQTQTPSNTQTQTPSNTQTQTPSNTQTQTPSNTQTPTPSYTPTQTPSNSQPSTPTPTPTPSPSPEISPYLFRYGGIGAAMLLEANTNDFCVNLLTGTNILTGSEMPYEILGFNGSTTYSIDNPSWLPLTGSFVVGFDSSVSSDVILSNEADAISFQLSANTPGNYYLILHLTTNDPVGTEIPYTFLPYDPSTSLPSSPAPSLMLATNAAANLVTFVDPQLNEFTSNNPGQIIDASNCSSLISLNAEYCTHVEVVGCTSLNELNCSFMGNKEPSTLNVSGLESLTTLNCSYSYNINSINTTNCSSLQNLLLPGTSVTSLILADCNDIRYINVDSSANISTVNLSNKLLLTRASMSHCVSLTSINVSGCCSLTGIQCSFNPNLVELNASQCFALTVFDFNQCCSLVNINLENCNLNTEQVDFVLNALCSDNGTLNIKGNSEPSLLAYDSIISKGWTIHK